MKDQLQQISQLSDSLREDYANADYGRFAADAADMQTVAHKAKSHTDALPWMLFASVPVAGNDANAVRAVVSSACDVADGVLVPLSDAFMESSPSDLLKDGKVSVVGVTTLLEVRQGASSVLNGSADRLNRIRFVGNEELSDMVISARVSVNTLKNACDAIGEVAPALSCVFGESGKKTYLFAVLSQNQPTAISGTPLSLGTVTLRKGKVKVGEFQPYSDDSFRGFRKAVESSETTAALKDLFDKDEAGSGILRNPDCPQVAECYARAYGEAFDVEVDGVVFLTPSVLQDVLKVAGPVSLSDGTSLNGENAAKVLSFDLPWAEGVGKKKKSADLAQRMETAASQAAFAALEALSKGMTEQQLYQLVSDLGDGAAKRKVMAWLADESVEASLQSAGRASELSRDFRKPQLGVFATLEDHTQMGMYLDMDTAVGEGSCSIDGSVTYEVKTSIGNALSAADVSKRARLLVGEDGILNLTLQLYAPYGGAIAQATKIGDVSPAEGKHEAFQVLTYKDIVLEPGDRVTVTYKVTVPSVAGDRLRVVSNPTLTEHLRK